MNTNYIKYQLLCYYKLFFSKKYRNSLIDSIYSLPTTNNNHINQLTLLSRLIKKIKIIFTFNKLLLVLSIGLFLNNAQALSATTINKIQGEAPYLTFDGGITKVETVEPLLGIKLPNGDEVSVNNDTSSITEPIELATNARFDDVETLVTLPTNGNDNYPNISLNSLIGDPFNYWEDVDGDADVTATGTLSVKWQTADNRDITQIVKDNPHGLLTGCDMPYKLTLGATKGSLSTQYGNPNIRNFNASSHTYYFKTKIDRPYVCYAKPILYFEYANNKDLYDVDGPDWASTKGFRVQDISSPEKNFPSTGSDKLFFKLIPTVGITAQEVININGTVIQAESGVGVTLKLSAEDTNTVRVTLQGPNEYSGDKSFEPSVFKLYSDSSKNQLLYSFKLQRWYIVRSDKDDYYYFSRTSAVNFCNNLGYNYRLTNVSDLTNANNLLLYSRDGIPSRNYNYYRRQLSYKINDKWIGGLTNEWGVITTYRYPEANYTADFYWTNQIEPIQNSHLLYLVVSPDDGGIASGATQADWYTYFSAICVKP